MELSEQIMIEIGAIQTLTLGVIAGIPVAVEVINKAIDTLQALP